MPSSVDHSLAPLFRPQSIALVGVTERSLWSQLVFSNLKRHGFAGKVYAINPSGGTVFGLAAQPSCVAIGEPIDLALLMVPHQAIVGVLDDLATASIRNAVVLSSGFAETGSDGQQRQADLASRARERGIRLLGPNCLGFLNFVDRVPVFATQRRTQRATGAVGIVSQSGAVGNILADVAFHQGVPLTYLVSTGNEADIDCAAVIDYLADEPNTRAIAVFLESVRDSARFSAAALKAHAAGKPVVVLKVGASEISAKAAQAHTGALVGDDRVFDAACRQLGMIRTESPEDLVLTADLMARLGPISGGLAVAAMSGGMCEIAADRAASEKLPMPTLSDAIVDRLRAVMPPYGTPHNPLDFTGAAMLDPVLVEKALRELVQDPAIGVVACLFDAPEGEDPTGFIARVFQHITKGFENAGKPTLVLSNVSAPVSKAGLELVKSVGVNYFGAGVDRGMRALARASAWWKRRAAGPHPSPTSLVASEPSSRPASEREVLAHLAHHGVPVIPSQLATSAEEAARIAGSFAENVVIKIASPQIQHKSDVGGVAINVDAQAVGQAWRTMMDRVRKARPDAVLEGVLVSPMRRGGVELYVGTLRDPVWGPVLALGLGGIWVELLKDTALRILPVSVDDVLEMLDELRGGALLNGFRGAEAVNRRAVAEVVARIGQVALELGPDLVALELNPILCTATGAEALDGLAVWKG